MRGVVLALLLGALAPFGVAPHTRDGAPAPSGFLLDGPGVRPLAAGEAPAFQARFPAGERLDFAVSYYGVPIGHARIEAARAVEVEGRRYAHLVATARTNDFFSRFYRVDDRHEAFVDLERGTVARTRTRTLHGRKEAHEEAFFDWETHYVSDREVKFAKRRRTRIDFDFGPFVYDILDAFYALRTLPVREGFEASLPVYASEKVYGFHVAVEKRREVAHPLLGRVETLEVRPYETVDGEGGGSGAGRVVVAAEPGHLPLVLAGWFRASKRLRVGGMRAELVGYEPGLAAWPAPGADLPLPPAPVETSGEGRRPRWTPPAEVRKARERTGATPRNEREEWVPDVAGSGAPSPAGSGAPSPAGSGAPSPAGSGAPSPAGSGAPSPADSAVRGPAGAARP